MSSRLRRHCGLTLALLLLAGSGAGAQTLEVGGSHRDSASAIIRSVAASGQFLLLQRDTILPADFAHEGDVVVSRARVRLEGRMGGRVVVIGGELFVRPGATVAGPIAVAEGEVYSSGLATIGPVLVVPPEVAVRVTGTAQAVQVELTPPPEPPRLALTGIRGVGIPTYDRVNGATLSVGGRLRLGPRADGAALRATGLLHTASGAVGGILAVEAPLRGTVWGRIEGGRAPQTNDAWIRGDLANSVAALFVGSDIRNYYSSTYLTARVERRLRQPLVQGESFIGPWVGIRVSEDRSLVARDVFSVISGGDDWRGNPGVMEARIASALAGATADWRGATARAAGNLSVEWAPSGANDADFLQAVADARMEALAFRGHRLTLRLHAVGTLGDLPAPPQRWSLLGGPGTLPTEPDGLHRGDQLVFAHAAYIVPLTAIVVPVVGSPGLVLQQATGMAWVGEQDAPDFRQNLGLGLQFRLLFAELWIDPSTGVRDPQLSFGLSLPF